MGNSGNAGERKSRSPSPSLTRSFENWDTKRKDWNTDGGVGSRELTGSRAREVETRPSARGNGWEGSKTQDERKGEDQNRRSRSPSPSPTRQFEILGTMRKEEMREPKTQGQTSDGDGPREGKEDAEERTVDHDN